jgi:nucleoside-diphosphate-sugar epimerase
VRRFVHGSTIGVYGSIKGGTVSEDSALDPDNIYGRTKLGGEAAVRVHRGGPEWVIARISEVYGPGDRRLLKMFRGARKGRFPMIGGGANKHHLVYIDDLLDGLLAAAESAAAAGATFVLAGPRAYSSREMLDIVTTVVGGPRPRIWLPLGPMLVAANLCEGLLRPLGIQPPLHPRRMNFYRKSFEFSLDQAARAIGYTPRVAFEQGAASTAQWYRAQSLL